MTSKDTILPLYDTPTKWLLGQGTILHEPSEGIRLNRARLYAILSYRAMKVMTLVLAIVGSDGDVVLAWSRSLSGLKPRGGSGARRGTRTPDLLGVGQIL